jgi:hypothetical protein
VCPRSFGREPVEGFSCDVVWSWPPASEGDDPVPQPVGEARGHRFVVTSGGTTDEPSAGTLDEVGARIVGEELRVVVALGIPLRPRFRVPFDRLIHLADLGAAHETERAAVTPAPAGAGELPVVPGEHLVVTAARARGIGVERRAQ